MMTSEYLGVWYTDGAYGVRVQGYLVGYSIDELRWKQLLEEMLIRMSCAMFWFYYVSPIFLKKMEN